MKRSISILVFALFLLMEVSAQDTLRVVKNNAFTHKEHIRYRVYYGLLNAGYATLDIHPDPYMRNNRETFRCVGIGESAGAFDWFFKVRDRYETYVDKQMIAPMLFIRRVDEGGYTINQDYVFNHQEEKIYNGKEFKKIPAYIQDMLSAFYYARCIDFSGAKGGEVYTIPVYVDDSAYVSRLKFVRRENLTTSLGTFKCMLFRPVIQTGRIFKHEEDLNVWITDDENKIPLRAQASILVGSIKMDLLEYSGLMNPISKID